MFGAEPSTTVGQGKPAGPRPNKEMSMGEAGRRQTKASCRPVKGGCPVRSLLSQRTTGPGCRKPTQGQRVNTQKDGADGETKTNQTEAQSKRKSKHPGFGD